MAILVSPSREESQSIMNLFDEQFRFDWIYAFENLLSCCRRFGMAVVTGSDRTFLGLITMVATGPSYFGYLPPQLKTGRQEVAEGAIALAEV